MIERTITMKLCHLGYGSWIASVILLSICLPMNINNANTAYITDGTANSSHLLCYSDYFTHARHCDFGTGDGTAWTVIIYGNIFLIILANVIPILWLNHNHKWFKLNVKIESCHNNKITERSGSQ